MTREDDGVIGPGSIRGARRRLLKRGFGSLSLDVAGPAREIAVLELSGARATAAERIAEIGRLTPELKEFGFRYVAIDITDAPIAAGCEEQGSHDQEPRQERKGE